jgi:hypothetical protein
LSELHIGSRFTVVKIIQANRIRCIDGDTGRAKRGKLNPELPAPQYGIIGYLFVTKKVK